MSKVMLVGLALAVSVVAAGCGQSKAHKASAAGRDRTMAQLDRIVHRRVDSGRLPGIVAGMAFPDGSTRVVAYGDAGGGKCLDAGSVFEIGSITKVFTASVLSEMVQRGQVKLADPVARLLPPGVSVPSRGGRQITLLDLATHSSCLPREATNLPSQDPGRPYAGYTAARLYAFLKGYQLTRVPGARVEFQRRRAAARARPRATRRHELRAARARTHPRPAALVFHDANDKTSWPRRSDEPTRV